MRHTIGCPVTDSQPGAGLLVALLLERVSTTMRDPRAEMVEAG
jgi:hypothetical protein